jgi:hypothetical protein
MDTLGLGRISTFKENFPGAIATLGKISSPTPKANPLPVK